MQSFTPADLNKQVGEVANAAAKAPVTITRHNKPRFVMTSWEHYLTLRQQGDPRRVYGVGETPAEIAAEFAGELDRLAKGEGYDVEP